VINRLASQVPPKLADPKAQRALWQLAEETGERPVDFLHKRVLPAAVLLVLDAVSTPQRIQLGRRRLKDDLGRWLPRPPVHLLLHQFARFFRQQLHRAAEAILLDEPYPREHPDFLDDAVVRTALREKDVTAASKDSAAEERRMSLAHAIRERYQRDGRDPFLFPTPAAALEMKSLITTFDAAASPQERTLLRLLCDGASPAEARLEMGISQNNCRQILYRLRQKASGL
jgi:hypothetical protein